MPESWVCVWRKLVAWTPKLFHDTHSFWNAHKHIIHIESPLFSLSCDALLHLWWKRHLSTKPSNRGIYQKRGCQLHFNRYGKYFKWSLFQSLLVSFRGHIPSGFFLFWDDRIPTLWDLPESSCSFPLSQRSLGNVLMTNSVCPQWPQRSFLKTSTSEMSVSFTVTHHWLDTNIKWKLSAANYIAESFSSKTGLEQE